LSFAEAYNLQHFNKHLLKRWNQALKKTYWKLEPLLPSDFKKDLTCATLRSIALSYMYIARCGPTPPKALLQAIHKLKRCNNIHVVITKPDTGSGVVIMDKADYLGYCAKYIIYSFQTFSQITGSQ